MLTTKQKQSQILANTKFRRTKLGVISDISTSQVRASKKRGHTPPAYTNKELATWLLTNPIFHVLYREWVDSGYAKDKKPSVDRLDDREGYSFKNIQLMTWGENNKKAYECQLNGIKFGNHRRVVKSDIEGNDICSYISISEAVRCNPHSSKVWDCCNGKRNKAGGFRWRYV